MQELGRVLVPSLLGSSERIPLSPKHFRLLEGPKQQVQLWQMAILVGFSSRTIDQQKEDWPLEKLISEQLERRQERFVPQYRKLRWLLPILPQSLQSK